MVLFDLLQLARVFLYYLRIEYLWRALMMPLINRNGISARGRVGVSLERANSREPHTGELLEIPLPKLFGNSQARTNRLTIKRIMAA